MFLFKLKKCPTTIGLLSNPCQKTNPSSTSFKLFSTFKENVTNAINLGNKLNICYANSHGHDDLKLKTPKILVIFYPWLGSKKKHQDRYKQVYLSRGLDVLTVESTATDFLWPPNSNKFSKQVLNIINTHCDKYENVLFHTMSIGSFNFNALRMVSAQNDLHPHILQKCRGVIYDSVVAGSGKGGIFECEESKDVDAIDRMIQGLAQTNKNKVAQFAITSIAKLYFLMTTRYTVETYKKQLAYFRDQPLLVPTLFFSSKNDPMSEAAVLEKLCNLWKSQQIPVELKLWDNSAHARHLVNHNEEYLAMLDILLENVLDNCVKSG